MKKTFLAIASLVALSTHAFAESAQYVIKHDDVPLDFPSNVIKKSKEITNNYTRVTIDQEDAFILESFLNSAGLTFEKDNAFFRKPSSASSYGGDINVSSQSVNTFNDPLLTNQQSLMLELNNIFEAMQYQREKKSEVNVLVLDSGSLAHSDVVFSGGYNYISVPELFEASRDPSDYTDRSIWNGSVPCSSGHGVEMSGIIGAERNNANGIAGIADVNLYMARVVGTDCTTNEDVGFPSDIAVALDDALNSTTGLIPVPDVVNVSLSFPGACPSFLQTTINNLVEDGSVVVVSAGNDGGLASSYAPANCDNVIVVGAHSETGDMSSFTNTGPQVDFSLSGTHYTTTQNNDYGYVTGTSGSAAAVSGVVSLVKAMFPDVTHAQVETVLKASSRSGILTASCGELCGRGVLDSLVTLKNSESLFDPVVSFSHPYADAGQCKVVRGAEALSSYIDLCSMAEVNLRVSYAESTVPAVYSYDLLKKPAGSTLWYGNSSLEVVSSYSPLLNRDKFPVIGIDADYDYAVVPCGTDADGERVCMEPVQLDIAQLSLPATCR